MTTTEDTRFNIREVPWYGLGTITDDVQTAAEAIVAAGLDWKVELDPLYVKRASGLYEAIPDRFAVIRDSDGKILGNVGSHYVLFQNEEAFEFCDHLVDSGDAKYESAGTMRGGKMIFLTMKVPTDIHIAGEDACDLYILLRTSHDGTKAIQVYVTVIRLRCTNMMSLATYAHNVRQKWSTPHVSTVQGKLAEARDTLKMTMAYADEFKSMGDRLAAIDLEVAEFEQLLGHVIPDRPKKPEVVRRIVENLRESPTIQDDFRRTAWGGLNAITEFFDWQRDTKSPEARFLATVDGVGNVIRNRAASLLLARG